MHIKIHGHGLSCWVTNTMEIRINSNVLELLSTKIPSSQLGYKFLPLKSYFLSNIHKLWSYRFHINIQNIAGHCCHGWHHVSNIKGTIGQHNRGEHDDGEFTVFMKSKHKHSEYRQSTLENDICILKTKRKITKTWEISTKIMTKIF